MEPPAANVDWSVALSVMVTAVHTGLDFSLQKLVAKLSVALQQNTSQKLTFKF